MSYSRLSKPGHHVQVTENGGVFAGRVGVTIAPVPYREVRGMYEQPDPRHWACLRLNDGEVTFMPVNRLRLT